jgi:hypothetical protein
MHLRRDAMVIVGYSMYLLRAYLDIGYMSMYLSGEMWCVMRLLEVTCDIERDTTRTGADTNWLVQ